MLKGVDLFKTESQDINRNNYEVVDDQSNPLFKDELKNEDGDINNYSAEVVDNNKSMEMVEINKS